MMLMRLKKQLIVIGMLILGASAVEAPAQNVASTQTQPATTLRERLEQSAQPLPEGQSRVLQAVVIDVKGQAQWRPGEEAQWKDAKVDDLLDPGAQIRTGLKSSLALRVGKNSTVIVDRSSRLDLPQIVQDGAVLRTRAAVRRGKADIKVDQIGLTNDFEVITPTTTLAVRGTGFTCEWGAWGFNMQGLPTNKMFAIEVMFLMSKLKYYLSQNEKCSEDHPDPVLAALFETIGPPPIWNVVLKDQMYETLFASGLLEDRYLQDVVRVQNSEMGRDQTQQFIDIVAEMNMPPEPPPGPPPMLTDLDLLCQFFDALFDAYRMALVEGYGLSGRFGAEEFDAMLSNIQDICDEPGSVSGDPFQAILSEVRTFCNFITQGKATDQCVEAFEQIFDGIQQGGGGPGGGAAVHAHGGHRRRH